MANNCLKGLTRHQDAMPKNMDPPRQFGNVNGDAWREKTVFMEGDGPDGWVV